MKNPQFRYQIPVLVTLFAASSMAIAEQQSAEQAPNTDLASNLNTLNQYYQQLNNKLKTKRDPFAYTDEMYRSQQSRQSNALGQGSSTSILNTTPHIFTNDGLPIMKYRGFAKSAAGEAIGLLEVVGMGVYTVKVGDKIGLHALVKELVITVEGLNRNNIIVETGKLGKKMVVQ